LQQLAAHLRIDGASVTRLERETAYRIASMPYGPEGASGTSRA
jgi:hypothetical protein